MVEKNKEYTVKIENISSDGNGIAHIDGFAVFVPQTAAGDTAEILIVKVLKRFAYGKLLKIITPSPLRCEPNCAHYKRCGGCQLRHIKYDAQLEIKKDIIENAMRRIGAFEDFALDGITGMDKPERYRNKMVFPIGRADGKNVCGFYAQRSHSIIPLTDCAIGDEINGRINSAVLEYMNENGVSAYDESSHTGVIRRVFTRKSFCSGEIMVVISANARKLPKREKLIAKLRNISDKIVGVILNINMKRNNLVITDENVTLWGADRISDTLCGIKFMISPQSFFQINPVQTEKLYQKALEYAEIDNGMSVMDIYCGIGTISLCAAKRAKRVVGVEIVEKAIADAKENAENNGIKNAEFYADSAENIVPILIAQGETPDIVILDPPRKGSDDATLAAIVKAMPKRIVYVSCNPSTLARDTRRLADNGYTIEKSQAFDLFPHTTHVETVCLLSKLHAKEHIEVELNMDELDLTAAESKATYEEIKKRYGILG
ncbi:MAG: 23S rRNA (uracil(1939)-C(5))-methyltransferase RlmD [Firmicutes bacterium]|nr:23S rRNA (uracil(1939)-C(5))-methyltransferase RlmD [Bacillota bacterium]